MLSCSDRCRIALDAAHRLPAAYASSPSRISPLCRLTTLPATACTESAAAAVVGSSPASWASSLRRLWPPPCVPCRPSPALTLPSWWLPAGGGNRRGLGSYSPLNSTSLRISTPPAPLSPSRGADGLPPPPSAPPPTPSSSAAPAVMAFLSLCETRRKPPSAEWVWERQQRR